MKPTSMSPPTSSTTRGLSLTPRGNTRRREKVRGGRSPASLFDWARKSLIMTAFAYYENGDYDESITAAKRYVTLASRQPGCGLRAVFSSGPPISIGYGHFARSGSNRKGRRGASEVVRQISQFEYAIAAKKKIDIARDQLAGKESISGAGTCKSAITPAHQPFQVVVTRYQTTRQRRGSADAAHRALLTLALSTRRKLSAPCSAHTSRTALVPGRSSGERVPGAVARSLRLVEQWPSVIYGFGEPHQRFLDVARGLIRVTTTLKRLMAPVLIALLHVPSSRYRLPCRRADSRAISIFLSWRRSHIRNWEICERPLEAPRRPFRFDP